MTAEEARARAAHYRARANQKIGRPTYKGLEATYIRGAAG